MFPMVRLRTVTSYLLKVQYVLVFVFKHTVILATKENNLFLNMTYNNSQYYCSWIYDVTVQHIIFVLVIPWTF